MTLDASIMLTGAIIVLLPFLGLPRNWDDIIFFVLGLIVIALGIVVRRRASVRTPQSREFVQNVPPDARAEHDQTRE